MAVRGSVGNIAAAADQRVEPVGADGDDESPRARLIVRSSPYSLRHAHSRRDMWWSGYSRVMPIAPWAWCACRVASVAA